MKNSTHYNRFEYRWCGTNAAALEAKVLNNTINHLNNIINSARKSIIENYAIDTIISKFEDLY